MANKKCCETTVTQQSINEKISFTYEDGILILIIGNKKFTIPLDIETGGGGIAGEDLVIPITSNGQVSFTNAVPAGKEIFALFINGIKEKKSYYSVPGGTNISWLGPYILETTDELTIWLKDS